jgi:outer membrane protein assembly factor BamB
MNRYISAAFLIGMLGGCGGGKIVSEPPASLVDFAQEAQIKELWSVDIGGMDKRQHITLSPHLDDHVIYATDYLGRVSALKADSGQRLWATELKVSASGATGVGEGLVLVGTKKGQVIALDKTNGKRLWESKVSSEVMAPPVAGYGFVVVQTIDGKIFGLSASDGKRLWIYDRSEPPLSLLGTSTPLIVSDIVISGFASGLIAAVELKSGQFLWELPVGFPRGRNEIERLADVDANPFMVGDTLYAAGYQGKIIAANMRDGRIAWAREVSTYTGMDADEANLYLSDAKGHVIALDQRTGSSVWKQDKLHGRILNAPSYIGGYIAVGDYEGYVHWLSREDGRLIARHRLGKSAIRAQGIVSGEILYVANQRGLLAALRLVRK